MGLFRQLEWQGKGYRLHYQECGEVGKGPTWIFVHGTPTSSEDWLPVMRLLSADGHCLAPDLLGFGLSERPADEDYGPRAHARRLRAWLEAMPFPRAILVLHDLGGPIGLAAASGLERRLSGLVLTNTHAGSLIAGLGPFLGAKLFASPIGRLLYGRFNFSLRVMAPLAFGGRGRDADRFLERARGFFPEVGDRILVLHRLAASLAADDDFYREAENHLVALSHLPALLAFGTRDFAFGKASLRQLHASLPQARIATFPSAGHWPQIQCPEAYAAAVSEFGASSGAESSQV